MVAFHLKNVEKQFPGAWTVLVPKQIFKGVRCTYYVSPENWPKWWRSSCVIKDIYFCDHSKIWCPGLGSVFSRYISFKVSLWFWCTKCTLMICTPGCTGSSTTSLSHSYQVKWSQESLTCGTTLTHLTLLPFSKAKTLMGKITGLMARLLPLPLPPSLSQS